MIRAAHDKSAEWPGLRLGLAQDAFAGAKYSSTFSRTARQRIAGVCSPAGCRR